MPFGVCVETWVSVALFIDSVPSEYGRLHGHDYKIRVCVEGEPRSGLVLDHYLLLRVLRSCLERVDHHNLNEVLDTRNATAEALVSYIHRCLSPRLPVSVALVYVEACTATGMCSYYREEPTREPVIREKLSQPPCTGG